MVADHHIFSDQGQIRPPDTIQSDLLRQGANPPAEYQTIKFRRPAAGNRQAGWQAIKSLIDYYSLPEIIPVAGPQKIEEKIFLRNFLQVNSLT